MFRFRKYQNNVETDIGCRGRELMQCVNEAICRHREMNDGEIPTELIVDEDVANQFELKDGDLLPFSDERARNPIFINVVDKMKVTSSDPSNPNPIHIFLSGPSGLTNLCQNCPSLKAAPQVQERPKVPLSVMDIQLMDALKQIVMVMFPKEAAEIKSGAELAKLILELFKELKMRRDAAEPRMARMREWRKNRNAKEAKKQMNKISKKCKPRGK